MCSFGRTFQQIKLDFHINTPQPAKIFGIAGLLFATSLIGQSQAATSEELLEGLLGIYNSASSSILKLSSGEQDLDEEYAELAANVVHPGTIRISTGLVSSQH